MNQVRTSLIVPGVSLHQVTQTQRKTNSIFIEILRPLRREEAAKNALLTNVLAKGCAKFPSMKAIGRELERLYDANLFCSVRKKGEVQALTFSMQVVDDAYTLNGERIGADACNLLLDVMLNPLTRDNHFERRIVDLEKENLKNQIKAQVNDKMYYAINECYARMCRDEAFGVDVYGSAETVAAIDEKNLYAHYLEVIASSRMEIFVIGAEMPGLEAQLKASFASLVRKVPLTPIHTEIVPAAGEVRRESERFPVSQSKLSLGFRTGITGDMADFPALVLANAVYGSGVTSKLFVNVREKLSLCYYCASRIEKLKGVMVVSSGIETKHYQAAKDEILLQLDKTKKGEITGEEIDAAKLALTNAYRQITDTPAALEDWYLGELLCGKMRSPEEFIQSVQAVDREGIVRVAEKIDLDLIYFLTELEAGKGENEDGKNH